MEQVRRSFSTVPVLISVVLLLAGCTLITVAQERRARSGIQMKPTEISTESVERMVDVGGRKLDCKTYGSGSPVIVLVSGLNAPQWTWNSVVPDLADLTTVVTYDRPGYGQSEMGDAPNHAKQAAQDLNVLLGNIDLPGPYLMVGHSYGGRVVRLFASMFPDSVAGLVIEDSQYEDILEAQRAVLKGGDLEMLERMVSMMKAPANPRTELEWSEVSMEQARNSGALPRVPYVVLTSGDRMKAGPPGMSEAGREQLAKVGQEMQKKLVGLIPGGKHVVVEGAGHFIHQDKPEAFIREVRAIVEKLRKSAGE